MRKIFLTFLFVFISHISSAPNVDFGLGMLKFKSLTEFVTENIMNLNYPDLSMTLVTANRGITGSVLIR